MNIENQIVCADTKTQLVRLVNAMLEDPCITPHYRRKIKQKSQTLFRGHATYEQAEEAKNELKQTLRRANQIKK
jgi:hypothetical protein